MGYRSLSACRGELMGLAMLWVMLFHADHLTTDHLLLKVVRLSGSCGVDVFLLLSAMGLAVSLSRSPALGRYFRRRFARVLPAFWLVAGVYGLCLVLAGRLPPSILFWDLSTLYFWVGIPGAFNWYIPALLAFYLAAPFCCRALKRTGRREWLVLLWAAVGTALTLLAPRLGLAHLAPFLSRIPIFSLGLLMGLYVAEDRRPGRLDYALWAAGLIIALAMGGAMVQVLFLLPLPLPFALAAVPLCLLAAFVLERWSGGLLRRFLGLVGACSLEIYLLNVVFTREYGLLSRVLPAGPHNLIYYICCWCLNLLLGILLHRGLEAARQRLAVRRPREETG